MNRPILAFLAILFLQTPLAAAPAFEPDDLPSFVAPLKWEPSSDEVLAQSGGSRIENNNYSAEYFGKLIRVDAQIFTESGMPLFGEAQITLERFEGRHIGIRINTTDLDSRCWADEAPVKGCRKDDRNRLHQTFLKIKSALEKQYGPGIVQRSSSDREPSVQWRAQSGHLMLFLNREEFDGWTVGLWIARR